MSRKNGHTRTIKKIRIMEAQVYISYLIQISG